jgi:energy-coupling factor transporter ATP-binding protein EcfA2
MPGSRLNDTEKKLLKWWSSPTTNFDYPVLASIRITGEPGLRGIRELKIPFEYPLTVICGKNGSGKTTILSLAALGFHSPPNHIPLNARRKPKLGQNFTYYTFSDFFFRGPTDPDLTGIEITWQYKGDAEPITVKKRTRTWMKYERRPIRAVHYLGVSRIVPAIERGAVRTYFRPTAKSGKPQPLNTKTMGRLNEIMGRAYEGAELVSAAGYRIRQARNETSTPYTSFNMGAGEDLLIDLLYVLQECPQGSLIVIEEIELGLHPEALVRLAQHIQEIMLEKKLQIIASTHSEHFIDSIPRQARILLQKTANIHSITKEPTTRLAMGFLAGGSFIEPELLVYCEDHFANELIKRAALGETTRRINVLPVGDKSELTKQVVYHMRGGLGHHTLLVWDGEVEQTEIDRYIESAKTALRPNIPEINWIKFAGNHPPERWVIEELDCVAGYKLLSDQIGLDEAASQALIQNLKTCIDHHDIVFQMSEHTKTGLPDCAGALVRAFSLLPTQPLENVKKAINEVLNGRRVEG